jgi:glycosyltransferase involved in cell wall biosynthesis
MNPLAILWAQYGPYHFARYTALKQQAGTGNVQAVEMASLTSDYGWERSAAADLITLCPDRVAERLPFWRVFRGARRTFAELKIKVCILPGYAPKQSLAALLAAKSLGLRTVMMNESHAGTARARGVGAWVKRRLVGLFDAALVGGQPQKRYYASLGLPAEKIFTGYDAVDNDYFAGKAKEARSQESELRNKYALPEHYFLSLGRFIAKKNLSTLIRAYCQFLNHQPSAKTHLVMVGSGGEESSLRTLCQELQLPIYDKTAPQIANRQSSIGNEPPGVHFYGFRQIEENPVFYALADAFILPSLWEEWGLVVNEAMASGLPVVVSETVGCAEDLLEPGGPLESHPPEMAMQVKPVGLSEKVRANGFVFDPRSSEELSRVLLVLDASRSLRLVMGQASRRIVEKFSCGNFARNALLAVKAATGDTASPIPNSKTKALPAGPDTKPS